MLKALQQLLSSAPRDAAPINQGTLNLAAAALLVEVMYVDDVVTNSEREQLAYLLEHQFHIAKDDIQDIISQAEKKANNANDFYQFTRLINDHFTYAEKCNLLEALWQIALADNSLDKYEESTIRKIADLLYVEHVDFIHNKKKAKQALQAQQK